MIGVYPTYVLQAGAFLAGGFFLFSQKSAPFNKKCLFVCFYDETSLFIIKKALVRGQVVCPNACWDVCWVFSISRVTSKSNSENRAKIDGLIQNPFKYMDWYMRPITIHRKLLEIVGKWLGYIQPMCSKPGHSWQGLFVFVFYSPFS